MRRGCFLLLRQGNINVSQVHKYGKAACETLCFIHTLNVFITFKIWAHIAAVMVFEFIRADCGCHSVKRLVALWLTLSLKKSSSMRTEGHSKNFSCTFCKNWDLFVSCTIFYKYIKYRPWVPGTCSGDKCA